MNNDNVLYQIKSLYEIIIRNIIRNNNNIHSDLITKNHLPTPTQLQIVRYIINNKNNDIYQKDLEKILNLRRATVSGVLKTMEKNNLIKRVSSDIDSRTKKIILTDNTKKIFKNSKEQLNLLDKKLTNNIKKKDLETFLKVINTMITNLNKDN